MKEVDELNEKVKLLEQMVKPLLRFDSPKIGDSCIPLKTFNKSEEWINAVIGSRPAINLKAQSFGKIQDFDTLAFHVYGNQKKRVARDVFKKCLERSMMLLQSMRTCYPLTWDEPAEFVDTVDKVTFLLTKVVDILTNAYSTLNGSINPSPETEVINPLVNDSKIITILPINVGPDAEGNMEKTQYASSNGLEFKITTGLPEEPIKIDALTCAIYSMDYVDIDKPEETLAAGKGKLGATGRKKSCEPTPEGFHLKDWVKDGYWPLLEPWLIRKWGIVNDEICNENLHLNVLFTPKVASSLLIELEEAQRIVQCGTRRSYTAEQAVKIMKETFGVDCSVETYRSYHKGKVGYELYPLHIPEESVVKPKS